jgi:hypothetical protein
MDREPIHQPNAIDIAQHRMEVSRTLCVFGPRTDIEEGGGWSTFGWMRPHEVVD